MTTSRDEIQSAFEARKQLERRLREDETPEQRLERFVRLQQQAFEILAASPEGFQHFLRRNYQSRRMEVVHGQWRPVSPDRRFDPA